MKWLITGGCGFIGTSILRQLKEHGCHSVRILDNLSVGTREDLSSVTEFNEISSRSLGDIPTEGEGLYCELVVGDIIDEQLAMEVCKGADVIVHLAANTGVGPSVEEPRKDCMLNVIGTFNYLEAARHDNVPKFIFASSGAPAGEVEPPIHEELPPHPVSPYGASKLAGEGYCSAYFQTYGVNTICLRFGNVYGPGSGHKASVVAKFIKRALSGETLEIYGDGKQTRDFIYIDDLVNAVLLSAEKEVGGEVFQIATSQETTVGEITEKLVNILEAKGIEGIEVKNTEVRLGDVKRNFSDTSKAKRMLGWQPMMNQDEGLKTTIDWFLEK